MNKSACLTLLALAAGHALAAPALPEADPLDLADSPPQLRAKLIKLKSVGELVQERFGAAAVDLDGDGHKELVVIARGSAECGSGGCRAAVLQLRGGRPVVLTELMLFEPLGVTREKLGRWRALAVLDGDGRVQIANRPGAPLHGKPMVYALADDMAAAPAPANVPAQASPPAAAATGTHEVLGIRVGQSSAAEVRRILEGMKGPRGSLSERREELAVDRFTTVPGSSHVGVQWLQAPYAGCPNGSCETVGVRFSIDPGAERALSLFRSSHFPAVPAERMASELTQRWGTPSWTDTSATMHLLAWYWDGRGTPITGLAASSAGCRALGEARNVDDAWLRDKVARPMVEAGCAGGHLVRLLHPRSREGLVDKMEVSLVDAAGLLANAARREQVVQDFRAREAGAAKAAAERRTSPRQ